MTAQMQHAAAPFSFTVAGHPVVVAEVPEQSRRTITLALTADAGAVRRYLPAGLSPVLSRPGRAWALVLCDDAELQLGDLPPIRFGRIQLDAYVSRGDRSLPPGVGFAEILPKTTQRRFGIGTYALLDMVTNRFAHGFYGMMGRRMAVAGLRWEERSDLDRVTCMVDGEPALDLALRTSGRSMSAADAFVEYGVREGCLVQWATAYESSHSRGVIRPAAGALRTGSGGLAAHVASLGLASNGSVLGLDMDATTTSRAPQVAVEDVTAAELPMGSTAAEEPFVLVRDGREETVDQGLAALPFPADAELVGVPVSGWPPAPAPGSKNLMAGLRDRVVVPKGPLGWLMAWSMPLMHKVFYGPVAEVLDVQPDDRVLEVACGGGWFLHGFTSEAASVAGLDLSAVQIHLAERRLRDRLDAGSAELAVGDATNLPWEPDSFTAVTCMGSLEWFDDPGAALAEMHRVLQPGGRLVLGLGPLADPGAPADRTSQAMGISVWTEDEVRELLAGAGFGEPAFANAGEIVVVRAPA
jgi:hypothetical protein